MRIRIPVQAKTLIAAGVIGVAAAGCASSGASAEGEASERNVMVLVENNHWQDATVYVMGAGPRARLGTVTSMTSKWFRVPPTLQDPAGLRLRAELIGSTGGQGTGRILVKAGEEVRWTLENQLGLSSYAVR